MMSYLQRECFDLAQLINDSLKKDVLRAIYRKECYGKLTELEKNQLQKIREEINTPSPQHTVF